MLLLRNRDSKRTATILHAVPETTAFEAALHPDQRDMATNHGIPTTSYSHSSPSPSRSESTWSRRYYSNAPTSTSTRNSPISDTKSSLNHTSFKGAIGTYKNGKIQWRHKDRTSLNSDIQSADGTSRPKIQVVIPSEGRDRPLPRLPFFDDPSKTHLYSNVPEPDSAHEVSPPYASNRIMRDSIVSPLSQLQRQPISFRQFQRTVSQIIPKSISRTPRHYKNASASSNSSNESQESDVFSVYSNRSSRTSVEADIAPTPEKVVKPLPKLPSVQNLTGGGILDAPSNPAPTSSAQYRIPPSSVPPRQYTHQPPTEQDAVFQPTCEIQSVRRASNIFTRKPTLTRRSSKRAARRPSPALNSSMCVVHEELCHSTSRDLFYPPRGASPTLSEAEIDLQEQLASSTEDRTSSELAYVQARTPLTEDYPFKWDELAVHKGHSEGQAPNNVTNRRRKDSVTFEIPDMPPPVVPRKSSKRQSANKIDSARVYHVPHDHIASQMNMGRPRMSESPTNTIPEFERMRAELVQPSTPTPPRKVKPTITSSGAETVILNILRSLDNFQDLFATAVVNRGFYRVFKRHELDLIKATLRKMSPPAWEFRELAFPGHELLHAEDLEMTRPEEEYTPSSYLQLQKRDGQVLRAIKTAIMEKCQSFVRPEISAALTSEDAAGEQSARVDDALWRIWTFCKIFGEGKGREEDVVAQMDWLRGGLLVHQQTCTFSIMSTDYMNDTLVCAPESFALGNEGGLTAEQLFDMMELWNCLGVLLQDFEGQTAQARQAGIYDNTDIRGGDIDGEEMMLDEWCYHLLTRGLSTILTLTLSPSSSCAFTLAAQNGWTQWSPPVLGGTRRHFLKEASSRVYEDKIANTYAKISTRDVQRQQSKLRIQKHISELKNRKNSRDGGGPLIRMEQERPMSEWDTVIGNLTRGGPPLMTTTMLAGKDIVSYIPSLGSAGSEFSETTTSSVRAELAAPTRTPLLSRTRTVAQPLLPTPPPSMVPSTRDRHSIETARRMPAIEDHPAFRRPKKEEGGDITLAPNPAFRNGGFQHEAQVHIYGSQRHENTAEKAIWRVVEMGFTANEAREALRVTDLGIGLRVDRAVEFLLSRGGV